MKYQQFRNAIRPDIQNMFQKQMKTNGNTQYITNVLQFSQKNTTHITNPLQYQQKRK